MALVLGTMDKELNPSLSQFFHHKTAGLIDLTDDVTINIQ